MYTLKSLNQHINERYNQSVWRNTNHKWLYELLRKKRIRPEQGRFISFSLTEDSGGQDDFGGTRIKFNRSELDKQGLIEIYYEPDFFEEHPEVSLYVTGFKNEQDYYEQLGYDSPEEANANHELTWEQYIEGYAVEEELVLKQLRFNDNLIEEVLFIKDKPSNNILDLLKRNNVYYEK